MAQYKLIDAISIPMTLNVATTQGKITRYGHIRLEPGKLYELPTDDVALVNSLRNAKTKKRYTPELEDLLAKTGADYQVVMCKACGGKVRKLEYHVVEVIE